MKASVTRRSFFKLLAGLPLLGVLGPLARDTRAGTIWYDTGQRVVFIHPDNLKVLMEIAGPPVEYSQDFEWVKMSYMEPSDA